MTPHRPAAIGIGIFGYGFVAGAHLQAIRSIAQDVGLRPVAVCGPRKQAVEAFAAKYGVEHVFTDPQALLARQDVHAVIVATPDDVHRDLAVAAARAGKHIFCEKPLALNGVQAQEIVTEARSAGVRGMTGFLLRYSPIVQTIAAMVERGDLGQVLALHTQRYNASLLRPSATASWRHDPTRSGSGVLSDLGSHMIDLALLFGGPIVAVSADLRTFVSELRDRATDRSVSHILDDDVVLMLRFASGAHGSIALSRVGLVDSHHPLGRSYIQVQGTKAAVDTDGVEHAQLFQLGKSPQEIKPERSPAGLDHAGVLAYMGERMLRAFAQSMRESVDLPPTLEDGLRVQAVVDAALRAHQSRRWDRV